MAHIDIASLSALFDPRSIAIVGASSDPAKIGGRPLRYLTDNGYTGDLYPVNPRGGDLQGIKAYASVAELPVTPDLAIIATPGPAVKQTLEACAAKGVRAAVVFTSGFAEVSDEGGRAQAEFADIGRRAGMRIIGPNCWGVANFNRGMIAAFSPVFAEGEMRDGNLGIVSQSGSGAGYTYQAARDLGLSFRYLAATGNEADIDLADCLAYLAGDPEIDAIVAFMECCRDGAKLIEALELARANAKPVVVLKVGETAAGAAAAQSHTAALAGSDPVFDAVFRQFGVYRARDLDELFDVAYACANGSLPRNDKVGILTVSGGAGVMMADAAERGGLDVAPMPEPAQAAIKALVPFAGARNPVDATAQVVNDFSVFEKCLELMLTEGDYASIACFQGGTGRWPEFASRFLDAWKKVLARHPGTLVSTCSLFSPEVRRDMEAAGLLTFEEPTRAVRALAALAHFARAFADVPARPTLPAAAAAGAALPGGPFNEITALQTLADAGIPTVPTRLARTAAEARQAADAAGYPVVLKIVSPDIAHKSDIGGVALGLKTPAEVATAFDTIMARVGEAAPNAAISGVLVAPMVAGGVETILGVHRDPDFGPVVMFGLGGIFTEVMRDVSFRAAPIGRDEAHRMIREIRGYPVLTGVRGRPPADIEAIAEALHRLSLFAARHGEAIDSVDINPFIVHEQGHGATAVDAVILARG